MTPIWYEHNDQIYNLAKVCYIFKMKHKTAIRICFSGMSDNYLDLECKDTEDQEIEFERIKTVLDKIY